MPMAWYVSRVCEEFGCVPSVALREIEQFPDGLLEDVMEARAFMSAKARVDAAEKKGDIPGTPMCQLVVAIGMDEARRALRGE